MVKARVTSTKRRAALHLLALAGTLALAVAQAAGQQAGTLFGASGVSPQAVRQGVLGSCYFHASVAALASAAPDRLRGAIGRGTMGGYRVHLASGPDELVFPEDVKFGRDHGYDRSEGDWVLVLMRAYAQRSVRQSLAEAIGHSALIPDFVRPMALGWLNDSGLLVVAWDRAIRAVVNQDGSMDRASLKRNLTLEARAAGLPAAQVQALLGFLDEKGFFDTVALAVRQNGEVFGAYKSIGQGGIPVRVLEAFMGSAGANYASNSGPLMVQLERLHRGGVAVVAGTLPNPPASAMGADWFVPAHAYSVLDYDPGSQMVRLRNPWGRKPDPDGSFSLPLSVFMQSYADYSYSQ
ncbi:MAG: C2 family cysteine protease [Terracidiphilus sp.]